MNDRLLPYYNEELAGLRTLGAEFAAAHPELAGRLRMGDGAADDPHVERLIQAVAFLNARTARRLDDAFQDIVDVLLDMVEPGCLAPLPSLMIARFAPFPGMTGPHTVPRHSELDSKPLGRRVCRMRTCWPVTVWPLELAEASLQPAPFSHVDDAPPGAVAALRLTLRTAADAGRIGGFALRRLRIFVGGADASLLLERILHDAVAVRFSPDVTALPLSLPPAQALAPVGFAADEMVSPEVPPMRRGGQVMREFFAFPDKHRFFDLQIPPEALAPAQRMLHVTIWLRRRAPALERMLGPTWFRLGCTPVINLFRRRTDALALDPNRLEHLLIADARSESPLEIHTVLAVHASNGAGVSATLPRLFHSEDGAAMAWHARRRPGPDGDEIYLSFTNQQVGADDAARSVAKGGGDRAEAGLCISADTLCANRELPTRLPIGDGRPHFTLVGEAGAITVAQAVTAPTPWRRAPDPTTHRWGLLSRLSLNFLSLTGDKAAEALRAMLRLHDPCRSAASNRLIDAITDVSATRAVRRVTGGRAAEPGAASICHGVDVTVRLDASALSGSNAWLFTMALDQFFGLHGAINAFIRLTVETSDGRSYACPARSGDVELF